MKEIENGDSKREKERQKWRNRNELNRIVCAYPEMQVLISYGFSFFSFFFLIFFFFSIFFLSPTLFRFLFYVPFYSYYCRFHFEVVDCIFITHSSHSSRIFQNQKNESILFLLVFLVRCFIFIFSLSFFFHLQGHYEHTVDK